MVIFAIILLIFALAVGFLLWGVSYSSGRGKGASIEEIESDFSENLRDSRISDGIAYARALPYRTVSMKSHDGLTLSARYIENDTSDKVMILMHGYRSHGLNDFSVIVKVYYEMGFSVLIPDQRAHGRSEGKFITFGVRERFDCAGWARLCENELGKKRILLDGISMGGTTVLLATECGLPRSVKGIIADCSFTTPNEIISRYVDGMKLPSGPIVPLLNVFLKSIAGYDAYSVSTVEAMKKNTDFPVIFVHGEADGFVPCEMSLRAYEACAARKVLVTVPEADHGMSYLTDTEMVEGELRKFIAEVGCDD